MLPCHFYSQVIIIIIMTRNLSTNTNVFVLCIHQLCVLSPHCIADWCKYGSLTVRPNKGQFEHQRYFMAWVILSIAAWCVFAVTLYHFISSESRYLLFLTENYAALRILHHYLQDVVRISPGDLNDEKPMDTSTCSEFSGAHMEPFVLFGSSFPKDKEYTQVFYVCLVWCVLLLTTMWNKSGVSEY